MPGSSVSSNDDMIGDDGTRVSSDRNQFGWSKQHERGPCPPINVDPVPRGRMRGTLAPSLYFGEYSITLLVKIAEHYNICYKMI